MRVRTKSATFVENRWYGPGEEIDIAEHHYSPEVHEDLTPAAEPNIIHVDEVIRSLDDPAPIEPLYPEESQ